MSIAQSIVPEFDHEMAGTRKVLERVPEGRFDWKPHPKSMSLGRLATHLAEVPGWATHTMDVTEFDVMPPGQSKPRFSSLASRADILALFDKNVAAARATIGKRGDADFMVPWTLKKGGAAVFTLPRVAVLRSMVLNHNVHHRAQLGVYLRLLDIPVPALLGPTADET